MDERRAVMYWCLIKVEGGRGAFSLHGCGVADEGNEGGEEDASVAVHGRPGGKRRRMG